MKRNRLVVLSALALTLPVGITIMAMSGNQNAIPERPEGSCDIYAAGGTPCVAAHSTTRALYKSYNGPLYQVSRESDGQTFDVGIVQPKEGDAGGYANATAQDNFCANATCRITKLYDQSGKGNHLEQAAPGTFIGPEKGGFDALPFADMAPVTISGHKAYGVYIMPGMGLRNNNAKDLAINDEPEGIYYVINGKHFDSGCCFDYGNSSTNGRAVGTGTMETTYYGTSTAWGSGNGAGPWIMSDMEAGLFSGYNAKKNDVPSIDSWRFVSAFVDGGGGNKWDLRGGNAQQGGLTTYYEGVRPGTPGSNAYYPMNKKGGILLGNGGDNGNGSAGTFYEGVMTTGYPTIATTDKVQANVVAAKYDVPRVSVSRITTFKPRSAQDVTVSFTNTTGSIAKGVKLSIVPRKGWVVTLPGFTTTSKIFTEPIPAGATVSATFKVTSPSATEGGFITGKAEWVGTTGAQSDAVYQRVRNAAPVKINEVRFGTGNNASNQFIELYNASATPVDISNWSISSTPSAWAPVKLATIPAGTKLAPRGFYVLGLSTSGLVAPAAAGQNIINVNSTAGLEVGQQINIDGETATIASIGTSASPMTTLFIPVSTGPWLTFPVGSIKLPVTSTAGIMVGEKLGIDMGGNYEVVRVTEVGKAATQTNLTAAAKAGSTSIKVTDVSNVNAGDLLTINTGARLENIKVKAVVATTPAPNAGRGPNRGTPGELELSAPLKLDHMLDVDVAGPGTGISFIPATKFAHKSADAIQALGTGITLNKQLLKAHKTGANVISTKSTTAGYQGKPNQWYGIPLSSSAGAIALMDASGKVLVDGVVYGSQQSNSSANGVIARPDIATLEGEQTQGGCIVALPNASARGPIAAGPNDQTNRSIGRYPDGNDTDSNCGDFKIQNVVTLAAPATVGADNIKVANVTNLAAGQKLIIGSGANSENVVIATVGTTGAATTSAAFNAGATTIPVNSVAGFAAGQTITISDGANTETAVIATVTAARRGFGGPNANGPTNSITVTAPLKNAQATGVQVSGSGVTLAAALTKAHEIGTQVASAVPTPGAANLYAAKK
jgi:hypothetical protein